MQLAVFVGVAIIVFSFPKTVLETMDAIPTRLWFGVPVALIGVLLLLNRRADAALRSNTTGPTGVGLAVEQVLAAPIEPPTWIGDGTLLGSPVISVNRIDRYRAGLGGASVYDGSGRHLADVVPGAPSLPGTLFVEDPDGRVLLRIESRPTVFGNPLVVIGDDSRVLGEARPKRSNREALRLLVGGQPLGTMRPAGGGRPRRIVAPNNSAELAVVATNPGHGVLAPNPGRSWVARFERREPPEIQGVLVGCLLGAEVGFR